MVLQTWTTRFAAVAVFVTVAAIHLSGASGADPTYCREYGQQHYACNCHSCHCGTCHSCGCSVEHRFWKSCRWDGCSTCWCSPVCKCCYNSNCRYTCGCNTCCSDCTRTVCTNTVSYHIDSVEPRFLPATTGGIVLVHGGTFLNTHEIKCRFGTTVVDGAMVADNVLRCPAPPVPSASVLTLEVSLDNGEHWTDNNKQVTFYKCPNDCSGADRGVCNDDATCTCSPGYYGNDCSQECPGGAGSPCNHRTPAGNASDASCSADGTCNCVQGYWGSACQHECPGGSSHACSGHGTCTSSGECVCQAGWLGHECQFEGECYTLNGTQVCSCPTGRWGGECEHQCPPNENNPCNQHGQCTREGQCLCSAGFWGSECQSECPGGQGNACSGHSALSGEAYSCAADGTCHCTDGWWGDECQHQCPQGKRDPLPSTSNTTCSSHGRCNGNGACTCDSGWTGSACQIACPGLATFGACSFHGTCHALENDRQAVCTCDTGYFGADCSGVCPGPEGSPCNNHGQCSEQGQCSCVHGFWGDECAARCPGTEARPCSYPNGLCDSTDGSCRCVPGYFGADCAQECPGGAANPCNGNGTCVSSGPEQGLCKCNPGYGGSDCLQLTCQYDCYGHGDCVGGICQCHEGWHGTYCSTPNDVISDSQHGVIQFFVPPNVTRAHDGTAVITLEEEASVVVLKLQRTIGAIGRITCTVRTDGMSAIENVDFVTFTNRVLEWDDGDYSNKELLVDIIPDVHTELDEEFRVYLAAVTGGARLGSPTEMIIRILANEQPQNKSFMTVVEVVMRLRLNSTLVPRLGSDERLKFQEEFRDDLIRSMHGRWALDGSAPVGPIGLNESQVKVILMKEDPDVEDGQLVVLDFFPQVHDAPPDAATAPQMAEELLRLVGDPTSILYEGKWTQFADASYMPRVLGREEAVPDQPPPPTAPVGSSGGDSTSPAIIAVAVLVPLVVLIAVGVCCYVKRKPVTDWLLWKLGNFRFNTLRETRQRSDLSSDSGSAEFSEGTAGAYDPTPPGHVGVRPLVPEGAADSDGFGEVTLDAMPFDDEM